MKKHIIPVLLISALIAGVLSCTGGKSRVLIITSQSDQNWQAGSAALKQILDETGIFSSKVTSVPADISSFKPKFSGYKLVVIQNNNTGWSEETTANLRKFVENGGGLVTCSSTVDPLSGAPDSVSVTKSNSYEVRTMVQDHPVTKGLPARWMHADDVLINRTRPAGDSIQVLAAAMSDRSSGRAGRRAPLLFAGKLGKGRIFTTLMGVPDGKDNPALHCTGFIITLQRGAEWAATGNVTQELPYDFPTAAGAFTRPDFKPVTIDDAFNGLVDYDIQKSTRYYTCIQALIRKAAGDGTALSDLEKRMAGLLENPAATADAKKLILRELSWMGTDVSVPAIKSLEAVPELKDAVDYALTRLQK